MKRKKRKKTKKSHDFMKEFFNFHKGMLKCRENFYQKKN